MSCHIAITAGVLRVQFERSPVRRPRKSRGRRHGVCCTQVVDATSHTHSAERTDHVAVVSVGPGGTGRPTRGTPPGAPAAGNQSLQPARAHPKVTSSASDVPPLSGSLFRPESRRPLTSDRGSADTGLALAEREPPMRKHCRYAHPVWTLNTSDGTASKFVFRNTLRLVTGVAMRAPLGSIIAFSDGQPASKTEVAASKASSRPSRASMIA